MCRALRIKNMGWLVLGALLLIGFIAGLVWKVIDIERCRDAGGIIVAPLMRDQHCAMPIPDSNSSFPRKREPS